MATFPFELASPARLVFSGEVEQVDVPGAEGDFGVLAGHAPLIAALRPGILTIREAGGAKRLYVRDGFAEVNSLGLTVLAESATPVEELDSGELQNAQIAGKTFWSRGIITGVEFEKRLPSYKVAGSLVICPIATPDWSQASRPRIAALGNPASNVSQSTMNSRPEKGSAPLGGHWKGFQRAAKFIISQKLKQRRGVSPGEMP